MVTISGHEDDDNSPRVSEQVLTTPEWQEGRELIIQQFTRYERAPPMPRELRPHRNIALGGRLKLARIAFGLANAQGKFAESAGLRSNAYNMWETGENFPGVENAIKLCERYRGLTLDWIYRANMDGMPSWLANTISSLMAAEEERAATEKRTAAEVETPPVPLPPQRTKVVKLQPKRRRKA